MGYTEKQKKGFFECVESLKKYRRADIIDQNGKDLLEKIYVDMLPEDHVLNKTMLDNTTFLIGRKGTGKSTIFLRTEQELRKKRNYISCYIDVKTIFETSQTQFATHDYLDGLIPADLLSEYLIQRTFIQNILVEIINELDKKFNSFTEQFAKLFVKTKTEKVKAKLLELANSIKNDERLQKIEIPVLKKINTVKKIGLEKANETNIKLGGIELNGEIKKDGVGGGIKTDSGICFKNGNNANQYIENEFSNIFLQIFQVKEIISDIKEILLLVEIKHLFVFLDDYSEINDKAIHRFVDVILAPLNNWSEEFVKFKIAAYPGRLYYGKIDPGKIDVIYLDFYNLYAGFDRNKMEENAVSFVKRLLFNRIHYFTDSSVDEYFETSSSLTIDAYYELLFKVSMNVPRILGYILSYCYESKIIYDKAINRSDIERASERYYEEKIEPFFETTTYSLLSIDEKISILQLRELLQKITNKLIEIRKRIVTGDLKGLIYEPTTPYASHFYFDPRLEEFLKTLELNFFISKYNDMSDKDGKQSSIYNINYGLAHKLNILWGKPKGTDSRKYFIERPFAFTKIITDFLNESKYIHCINPACNKNFSVDDLKFLEFTNFKCNSCNSPVIIDSVSDEIKKKVISIETESLLPLPELKILQELSKSSNPLLAKEIAQEIDYSSYLVAKRGQKLEQDYKLVKREKRNSNRYHYELTESGKTFFKHE